MFKIECELGQRNYNETFATKEEAAGFVHSVLKDEPLKWKSPSEATAKGGVLILRSAELEDLVDMKEDVISAEIQAKVQEFLNGHWKNSVPEPKSKKAAPPKKEPTGLVTLATICKRHSWPTRVARVKLRGMKAKKHATHGWAWTAGEAKKIEAKLKELISVAGA